MLRTVWVFEAAAVEVDDIETTLPELTELEAKTIPLPVDRLSQFQVWVLDPLASVPAPLALPRLESTVAGADAQEVLLPSVVRNLLLLPVWLGASALRAALALV